MHAAPIDTMGSIGTSPPSKLGIIVTSILVPLCILALCTIVGLAGVCILLKIRKQRKERAMADEVNQPCYEVIDPIYETIPSTESTPDYFGIATMSNDAYTRSRETKCYHSPPVDFNTSSNISEAYVPNEKVLLSMQNNSSYQAAPPLKYMAAVMESEDPTEKRQCYDKQSIENIQQTELLCGSVKCISPKHVFN